MRVVHPVPTYLQSAGISSSLWPISFHHYCHLKAVASSLCNHCSICLSVYLSPPPLCCLLGNMCHSVLPPLARPTPGRPQLSSDPKPVLPLHLLPRFTDVSTVGHGSCHGNNTLTYCLLLKPQFITPVSAVRGGVCFVCLRGVIIQYTDV